MVIVFIFIHFFQLFFVHSEMIVQQTCLLTYWLILDFLKSIQYTNGSIQTEVCIQAQTYT